MATTTTTTTATDNSFIPMHVYKLPVNAIQAIFKEATAEMHISGKWVKYKGVVYPVAVSSSNLKEHMRRKLIKQVKQLNT